MVLFVGFTYGAFVAGRLGGIGHRGPAMGVATFIAGVGLALLAAWAVEAGADSDEVERYAQGLSALGVPGQIDGWRDIATTAGVSAVVGMLLGSLAAERSSLCVAPPCQADYLGPPQSRGPRWVRGSLPVEGITRGDAASDQGRCRRAASAGSPRGHRTGHGPGDQQGGRHDKSPSRSLHEQPDPAEEKRGEEDDYEKCSCAAEQLGVAVEAFDGVPRM